MTDRERKYLHDILNSIELIYQFLLGMNFVQYQKDYKTKSAVERQLGIIGEEVDQFYKKSTSIKLNPAREIVNLRNRIIHAYDSIDDTIIWAIKANHLPALKQEIEELISDYKKTPISSLDLNC